MKTKISVDQYLESERISPVKDEYVYGEIYAMAGASDNHNRIAGSIYAEFRKYFVKIERFSRKKSGER